MNESWQCSIKKLIPQISDASGKLQGDNTDASTLQNS